MKNVPSTKHRAVNIRHHQSMKKQIAIVLSTLCLISVGCKEAAEPNSLTAFENTVAVTDFAPALWLERNTYKGSFSDDFNTFYFFRKLAPDTEKYVPYISHFKEGTWQEPIIPDYYEKNNSYTYQLKVPESDKLIFISNKAVAADTTQKPNYNFWETTISDSTFSNPRELGYKDIIYNYNSQPCITKNGTIYFTSDLADWSRTFSYKIEPSVNGYGEPELFAPANAWREKDWTVYEYCMAPEEDYMIVCIQQEMKGSLNTDLYISFPKDSGWTTPKRLGPSINTTETENFPTITNDGKYLIFTRAFSKFQIVSTQTLLN